MLHGLTTQTFPERSISKSLATSTLFPFHSKLDQFIPSLEVVAKMKCHKLGHAATRKSGTSHQSEPSAPQLSSNSGNGEEPAPRSSSREQVGNSSDVAKREKKIVFRTKILVAFILLVAVCAVATSTYLLVNSQERSNFESQFTGYASEVVTASREKTSQLFSALDAYSVSVGSQAAGELQLRNSSWPLYSIPDWSLRTQRLAGLTGVDDSFVSFAPIVQQDDRKEWEDFANDAYPILYQDAIDKEGDKGGTTANEFLDKTIPFIFEANIEKYDIFPSPGNGEMLPTFQQYPLEFFPLTPIMPMNFNLLSQKEGAELFQITKAIMGPTIASFSILIDIKTQAAGSQIMQPVYDRADTADEDRKMVGIILIQMHWLNYFNNLFLEESSDAGIVVVLKSSCPTNLNTALNVTKYKTSHDMVVTYQIEGSNAVVLGEEDLHDPKYDSLEVSETFIDLGIDESKVPEGLCVPTLTLHVYPSQKLEQKFATSNRIIYTSVVVTIFAFTVLVFLLYDFVVGRLQTKVMDRINKQDMIVANVFPSAIRDRLYQAQGNALQQSQPAGKTMNGRGLKYESSDMESAPLADLFPNTSIIFADIAGFTAWSSAREPQQVFILLENIYSALDTIAQRLAIFKVETVGDCYVGAAGLPDPMDNHAVVACEFAREALKKMKDTTHQMEVSLGPDTAALDLRIGIHSNNSNSIFCDRSGQVTAGVLRGERSRFQLFGDTMNTASRMESSGERDRIQVTQATADLLIEAGYGAKWLIPRSNTIFVKGKGEMQTYWVRKAKSLVAKASDLNSEISTIDETTETEGDKSIGESSGEDDLGPEGVHILTKTERLVEWDVAVLTSLLQQILASRSGVVKHIEPLSNEEKTIGENGTVLEECTPVIQLKRFGAEDLQHRRRPSSIEISDKVKFQLRGYISNVASMYQDNPFHNFEHANHVAASVKKLLTRIVTMGGSNGFGRPNNSSAKNFNHVDLVNLAGHSYGITSDPLTQFSVVFSAIIHDLDHPGVPNSQLVKENTRCAQIYKNKSIAEQNSVDMAWAMLMQDEYEDLRACIYQTKEDLHRFRQLVVNTVMATDIVDKELQALRKARWETAFSEQSTAFHLSETVDESETNRENRKATVVIEHLIQASDVSHTMQHWHVYKAWNEKYFMECYMAYRRGRADSDPSANWYKGEIAFFDFYVIPLAKKLQSCGVFGVASDEYLNYAISNREEWVRKGEGLVKQYLTTYYRRQHQDGTSDSDSNKESDIAG
eukprot:scaffold4838_cov110-Cylindrotheca_fusiformis.AAC.6